MEYKEIEDKYGISYKIENKDTIEYQRYNRVVVTWAKWQNKKPRALLLLMEKSIQQYIDQFFKKLKDINFENLFEMDKYFENCNLPNQNQEIKSPNSPETSEELK